MTQKPIFFSCFTLIMSLDMHLLSTFYNKILPWPKQLRFGPTNWEDPIPAISKGIHDDLIVEAAYTIGKPTIQINAQYGPAAVYGISGPVNETQMSTEEIFYLTILLGHLQITGRRSSKNRNSSRQYSLV